MPQSDESPTFGEMLAEVLDLMGGLGILVLPLFPLAIPCLILLLPLALLALPFVFAGGAFFAIRWALRGLRRLRRGSVSPAVPAAASS